MSTLRPYQVDCVRGLRASIARGCRAPILVSPCGSGKTTVAGEIIEGAVAKGKRILFLAPRRELIFQTAAKLRSIAVPHGIIMAGERSRMYEPVQVASIPTLHVRYKATAQVPQADVIIIDECHLAVAATTKALLDAYPKGTVFIGLSATPKASKGKPLSVVFDDMVFGPSVDFLTAQGFLVPMEYYGPSVPDRTKLGNVDGDFNSVKAAERMDKPKLIGDVVENWARIARDESTVVFAQNISHARHLCERFVALGVRAENVDSETLDHDRADIFARIKSRETQVLTSVDVVTYGFDEPILSCGVVARMTKSIVRHQQMIGRLARVSPGKERSIIIDNAGNVDALGFFNEEYPWTLDGDESPPDKDERQDGDAQPVRKITCPKCHAMYSGRPSCPKCGSAAPSRPSIGVEVQHDELKRLDGKKGRKENRELTTAEKERFYGELKFIADARGYKPGWAAAQYRERLTVWPNAHKDAPPLAPSLETKAWVQSRLIKYAKSHERRA